MTFKFKPASPEELAQRKVKKAPLTPEAKAQRIVANMLGEEPKKPAPRRRTPAKPKE